MLHDYKLLLHRLTIPRKDYTFVKLCTTDNVRLFTTNRESQSSIIELAPKVYGIHLQAGDVIVQGDYTRLRKAFIISDLSEINSNCKIVQLKDSNNFQHLTDVPSGMYGKKIDKSLAEITKAILVDLFGVTRSDWDAGITVSPISDQHISIKAHPEQNFKRILKNKSHCQINEHFAALLSNGELNIISDLEGSTEIHNLGESIKIEFNRNGIGRLLLDLDKIKLSDSIMQQLFKETTCPPDEKLD